MFRAIAAVFAGYFVFFLILFIGMTGLYLALGVDRAYLPGSYEVSMLWALLTLVVGTIGALVGGCLCRVIAKRLGPVYALAAIVLIIASFGASFEMYERANAPGIASEVRPPDVPMTEAMVKSRHPIWMMWTNAAVGFAAILIGGRRKNPPPTTS